MFPIFSIILSNYNNDDLYQCKTNFILELIFALRFTESGCFSTGISLKDVQSSLSSKEQSLSVEDTSTFPYENFMVLKDQSMETGLSSDNKEVINEKMVFNHILEIPFDTVIQRKWEQVQR